MNPTLSGIGTDKRMTLPELQGLSKEVFLEAGPILSDNAALEFGEMAASLVIRQIGEDPSREGLQQTPHRFARAIREICSGYGKSLADVVGGGVFEAEGKGVVAVTNIEFFTLCEHHLLPFWGHVSVAYFPDRQILGLSKVARIVEMYARRLQVQERLTREIALGMGLAVSPRAVGVRVKAAHACMMMRGVEKQASQTVTEYFEKVEGLSPFERERLVQALG